MCVSLVTCIGSGLRCISFIIRTRFRMLFLHLVVFVFFLGCATSASVGSSPRGYVRQLGDVHRLNCNIYHRNVIRMMSLCFSSLQFFHGCATSASVGSSPRGYVRQLDGAHRLNLEEHNHSSTERNFGCCYQCYLQFLLYPNVYSLY